MTVKSASIWERFAKWLGLKTEPRLSAQGNDVPEPQYFGGMGGSGGSGGTGGTGGGGGQECDEQHSNCGP